MFCTNCGTRYDEGDRFCAECGARLTAAEEIAAEPSAEKDFVRNTQAEAVQKETKATSQSSFVKKLMSYDLPEDTVIKLPFPPFVLKFIRMGIWALYFLAVFFAWVFYRISGWGYVQADSANLFTVIFNFNGTFEGVSGGAVLVVLGLMVLLVLLFVSGLQMLNVFIPDKLPSFFSKIPQIALCAAPAALTFIFMIAAWIVMSPVSDMGGFGITASAGPGFGAWLVFILSGIETAAFFLFIKGRSESLFKA